MWAASAAWTVDAVRVEKLAWWHVAGAGWRYHDDRHVVVHHWLPDGARAPASLAEACSDARSHVLAGSAHGAVQARRIIAASGRLAKVQQVLEWGWGRSVGRAAAMASMPCPTLGPVGTLRQALH